MDLSANLGNNLALIQDEKKKKKRWIFQVSSCTTNFVSCEYKKGQAFCISCAGRRQKRLFVVRASDSGAMLYSKTYKFVEINKRTISMYVFYAIVVLMSLKTSFWQRRGRYMSSELCLSKAILYFGSAKYAESGFETKPCTK